MSTTITVNRVVDLLSFAFWVTLLVILISLPPSFLLQIDWIGVKLGLMLIGIITLGVALLLSKPKRPDQTADTDEREGTVIESMFDRLPPSQWLEIQDEDRFSLGTKIAAAGALMLFLSVIMETVLGIHV